MDWQKIFTNVKYELNRYSHRYKESEDIEERESCVNNYTKTLNYLQSLQKGEVPSFYKEPLANLYALSKEELETMRGNVKNIESKPMVDGGNPKKGGNGGGDDKIGAGLIDTIIADKPNVHWEDIAGLSEAKKSLHEALIMPIKYPNFFVGNVKPWKGILLYGPPGTGKTFLAKACATECESTFFNVSSSDLMSKYVGDSERTIKELFRMANERAPSIIFIDEIDSMCGNRTEGENEASKRVKTEFLVQMQGVNTPNERVLVLGATNLPWALDPAIRRRFERRVYIPLPDLEARMYLLRNKLKNLDRQLSDADMRFIAEKTDGYSGSDLEVFCKDAAMEPLRFAQTTNKFKRVADPATKRQMFVPVAPNAVGGDVVTSSVYDLPERSLMLPDLTRGDLQGALSKAKSSVSKGDLKQYEEWTKQFGVSD